MELYRFDFSTLCNCTQLKNYAPNIRPIKFGDMTFFESSLARLYYVYILVWKVSIEIWKLAFTKRFLIPERLFEIKTGWDLVTLLLQAFIKNYLVNYSPQKCHIQISKQNKKQFIKKYALISQQLTVKALRNSKRYSRPFV